MIGWFSKLFSRKANIATSLDLFRHVYGGRESSSGVAITIERALEVSAVLAVGHVLADGVAQVPFKLYQETKGSRTVATEHPLHQVISRRPNRMQTSFEFRETLVFHLYLAGNAYVFVNRVGSARKIVELVPLLPNGMTVQHDRAGQLTYKYRSEHGEETTFPADAIWHLRGPSWNGWSGMDALKQARNVIGLSAALEEAHAGMHRNGSRTSGLLSVKDPLSPEQYAFLAAWLDKYEIGGDRYQKAMLLDRGAEFTPMGMTGVDAQHLETRRFQIEEICRLWRVMPIMVGYNDKSATYASAEQMFLAHVVHTLSPWYARIEQSADANLLSEDDRNAGYYTRFQPNGLMRGAAKDRAEYYTKALGAGGTGAWMTQNEVRALEELNRHEDGDALARPNVNTTSPSTEVQP